MDTEEIDVDALLILNDDCIYQILEWLSLDELCVCSRVCKRLQGLCENHFRRKFPNEANEEVKIRFAVREGKLKYENYVKYFRNSIKNLTITEDNSWLYRQPPNNPWLYRQPNNIDNHQGEVSLANFVKWKCDRNLNKISIAGNVKLVPFCKDIEGFLENVKIVQFSNRTEGGQDEATFLKYCPKMTKLTLFNMAVENVNAIFQQTYHQLKHFHCMYVTPMNVNVEQLKMFYENNDQIQCAVWKFFHTSDSDGKHNIPDIRAVKCIQTVVDTALHLQHFFLLIDSALTKCFDEICSLFSVLCARENFKSLEIELNDSEVADSVLTHHAHQLAKFKQLTKIRLCGGGLFYDIPALQLLVHLKIIVLRYMFDLDTNGYGWLWIGDMNSKHLVLPQVEELQIQGCRNKHFRTYVKHFAKYWPNLKRILLPECDSVDTEFHIDRLNREREKLENACELTIFTDNENNGRILDHKLVKLELVDFETGFEQSLFSNCCMPSVE